MSLGDGAQAQPRVAGPAASRVLLVDDDRLVLSTLAAGLGRLGYEVAIAESSEDALTSAGAGRFDIALLDVRLADGDGIELARRLRQVQAIPMVFLSAFDDRPFIERAVDEGGFAYLVKPVTPAQIAPVIESVLARERDIAGLRRNADTLRSALERERQVSVAVGLIMERQRIGSRQAFEFLRQRARAQRVRVGDIAGQIINAAETLNALAAPGPEAPPRSRD